MENYGGRIKELRERHGLTQKELAEKLGVSAQAVSKWENNVNQPDVSTIRKLCAIFGISVDEFLQESIPQNMATPNITLTQNAQAIKPNKRKRFWIIFSICAGAILSFTFSFLCVFIPLSALWSNGKLSSQRIYKKVDPSVFFIEIETENGGKQGGSGFFIDKNGTAVTNYHVVQGGTSGRVVLANGREYEVESVLGKDKHSDLVIIKIDIPKSTPVKLADSLSVATGDRVYTIGYPESFALGVESSTFTEGIVSKASYTVEGVEYIQTNADITHGNSGGVLLNEKGEVIGITTGALASPLDENATVELYAKISPITFSVIILGADGQDLRSMSMQYGQDLTFENCLGIATDGKYYAESAKILNADKTEYTGDPRYACAQDGGVVYLKPDWQEQKYEILLQLTWLDVRGEEHTAYMDANGELQEETTWIRLDYSQEFTFPTPTIEGYAFNGWEYYKWPPLGEALGVYQGGDTICKFTENVGFDPVPPVAKFVAKLTPYTYVVRYDGNGAQLGSMADGSGAYGKAFTFANNAYIKSGCVFGGWLHGETLYSKNEQVYFVPTYDGEVILLKAHWISYTGAGTQAEPYLISTYEDLFNLSIAMQEKSSFRSAHYRMTADIDCQNKILYPIDGYTENTFSDGDFTGVFDGGGYVIKNAVFARKANGSQFYKGLFGAVRGATIKNLGVVDYTMEQTVATYTAPLVAGLFDGTVENCYADGNLACPVGGYIGGMIGRMVMGTVKNCKASGTLSVHYDIKSTTVASYYIGGFVGALNSGYLYAAATLERCYTDMDISLTKGEYNQIPRFYVGAFTGDVSGVAFTNCIATGNISMELVNVATDGTTFHGKFNGGLRWANGSLSASYVTFNHCYTSLEAVYNIDFVDDGNVTAKSNTELKSLSWLKENLGYDDTLWTENEGEITLRSFIRGS